MHSLSRNVLLIARREYLEKIRGRAFRFSTVLVPALMMLIVGASFFTSRGLGRGGHIVVAADDPALAFTIQRQLLEDKDAGFKVDVAPAASGQDQPALMQRVRSKAIDGFLWIQKQPGGALAATYTSGSAGDNGTSGRVKSALNRALLEERLNASGISRPEVDALLKNVTVESVHVDSSGKAGRASETAVFAKMMLEMFLLTMPILLYGMDMARSIIEEKSSRIFEVMLSVVQPGEMLTGKLIGIGAVGVTQIAIWVAAAGLFSGTALAATVMEGKVSVQFSWTEGILFPIYFVLGFFLYSALFSGLAATCETVQEFQMYAPLAILPTWFSFGIMPLLISDPNSKWSMGASLFPATAPFTMVPRIGLQMPPYWQIAASLVLLILSIWAVLWFSSRLYRVGILMYGKRATLPEIVRWLRYS